MRRQLLKLTLLSSFIVISNQCAATNSASNPTSSNPTATTTTTSTTTTSTVATTTTTVATTDCITCTAALIRIVTGNDGDQNPTSVTGMDANGCATITYTCERMPVVTTDVISITYFSDGADPTKVGTENGLGTANVVMTCVDGHWDKDGIEVDNVECQVIF